MPTDRSMLPFEERRVIQAEIRRLREEEKLSDTAIAGRIHLTQQAVSKARDRAELGPVFARAFYEAFGLDNRKLQERHGPKFAEIEKAADMFTTQDMGHELEWVVDHFTWPPELSPEGCAEALRRLKVDAFKVTNTPLPAGYWQTRLTRIVDEVLGRVKIVEEAPHDDIDLAAESPEVAGHRANESPPKSPPKKSASRKRKT